MRWRLQLLPYQLWPNTTRGSKIFVLDGRDGYGSDAEYRCPVVTQTFALTMGEKVRGQEFVGCRRKARPLNRRPPAYSIRCRVSFKRRYIVEAIEA